MEHSGHEREEGPLSRVAEELAPYVKTRQKALKIRRTLTVYLQSLISFPDDFPDSHLQLAVPTRVLDAIRIPPELTGLRKKYLKALQANVAARKGYEALTSEIRASTASSQDNDASWNGSDLRMYLALLQQRRTHEKLQILHHYLDKLSSKEAARSDYLDLNRVRKELPEPQLELNHAIAATDQGEGKSEEVEALVERLERAVVRAKYQLEREKALLADVKTKQPMSNEPTNGPPLVDIGIKVHALTRTRDELVNWVEEQLAKSSLEEEDPYLEQAEELGHTLYSVDERLDQIKQKYNVYLETRKALLSAATEASAPPSSQLRRNDLPSRPEQGSTSLSRHDIHSVLPFVNEHLIPLSQWQRSQVPLKSHLSNSLAKQKSESMRVLDRLQDESHLLPLYPILAGQLRFKNAIAALGTTSTARQPTGPVAEDKILTHARAWAFASDAARSSTNEAVEGKAQDGIEYAERAQEKLQTLYGILGQNEVTTGNNMKEEGEDEDDIWTAEVKRAPGRAKLGRSEKRPRGPWSGLNGKVGVIGDG